MKFFIVIFCVVILSFESNSIYGQESNIEIGKNYNRELLSVNPDGRDIFKWTSTPEKILDYYNESKNPVYVQSKFYETKTSVNFESMYGSYSFIKNDCTLLGYDGGKISGVHKKTLSHILKSALNGTNIWNTESVNEESCTLQINKNQIIVTKSNFNPIFQTGSSFDVIYDFNIDGSIEFTYSTTNNDITKTDQKYGFTFVCDGVGCNDILIDDKPVRIGEIKNKTQIINQVIKIGENAFDLKNESHDYFWELKHPEENKLVIDFTHSKGRLALDGTLTINHVLLGTASYAGYVKGDTSCITGDDGFFTSLMYMGRAKVPYYDCYRAFAEWDISSISTSVLVTDTVFKFERETPSTGGRVCDMWSMEYQPSTSTASQITIDAKDGTEFINATSFCNDLAATNQILDLGSLADSNLQIAITENQSWWAIGISLDDEGVPVASLGSKITTVGGTPNPTLEITYIGDTYPDAIYDLISTAITQTTVALSFSTPDLQGGNLTNYLINSTTPHGNPQTFALNTTSLTPTITGLSIGTDYSFRASALTELGYNATGNILNITTPFFILPGIPTLTANALSDSAIRYTSISGMIGDNSTIWYSLRCDLNSAGWSSIISNSSLPVTRSYDYTGLTFGDVNICQWRDGSVDGWSGWSNSATDDLKLQVIQSERQSNADPLKNFEAFIDDMGGFYFGLGLFPFVTMVIGFMAGRKTVRIFTLITLFLMGIIHASGFFIYPDWYWTLSLLLGLVLVLGRQRSD